MVLLCNYPNKYKKDTKVGFKWLNENATLHDFESLDNLLTRLTASLENSKGIKTLFNRKNTYIFVAAFKAFTELGRIIDEINLCRDELELFEMFSPNCFRHTFAIRCFEAGIQPKTVQTYLGHATLQMTMDLYTSVLENHRQEEMQKLESILNDVFECGDDIVEKRFKQEQTEQRKVIQIRKMGYA